MEQPSDDERPLLAHAMRLKMKPEARRRRKITRSEKKKLQVSKHRKAIFVFGAGISTLAILGATVGCESRTLSPAYLGTCTGTFPFVVWEWIIQSTLFVVFFLFTFGKVSRNQTSESLAFWGGCVLGTCMPLHLQFREDGWIVRIVLFTLIFMHMLFTVQECRRGLTQKRDSLVTVATNISLNLAMFTYSFFGSIGTWTKLNVLHYWGYFMFASFCHFNNWISKFSLGLCTMVVINGLFCIGPVAVIGDEIFNYIVSVH